MLAASAEQLERLISTAQALERHAREAADELIDMDDGQVVAVYGDVIEDIEADIAAFNQVRLEIEGVQGSMSINPQRQEVAQ
ncbi:MAG: hypothetical protein VBE63_18305 [Lamprobacter sp.]|uniref:hypothetical protein n=1 Tax=Lamprobacter sp. TaxID=3100796 RepID=UPI002B259A46|nr:hypothetical protein [Lamprobacter sp.]MEA3641868.1 hypothetical protein [Lamprobacter sp.]